MKILLIALGVVGLLILLIVAACVAAFRLFIKGSGSQADYLEVFTSDGQLRDEAFSTPDDSGSA